MATRGKQSVLLIDKLDKAILLQAERMSKYSANVMYLPLWCHTVMASWYANYYPQAERLLLDFLGASAKDNEYVQLSLFASVL